MYKCKSCGAIDSRRYNGDNSICTECGTPDDFEDVPTGKESKELKINKPKNQPTL